MNKSFHFAGGAGLGAALVYYADTYMGARRRALVRDKAIHLSREFLDFLGRAAYDIAGRSNGIVRKFKHLIDKEEVADEILVERVRSKMGRYVSHPHALDVAADCGHVTLSGPILEEEHDSLIAKIRQVPGVRDVEDRLEKHRKADQIPALQGGVKPAGEKLEFLQANWSPATRLIVGLLGSWMFISGMKRMHWLGGMLSLFGLGLLARGVTNLEMKRLTGIGAGRRAVDLQKTININAPVDQVFRLWTKYENFPRFMPHVIEVKDIGEGRSHWKVKGLNAIPVEWDAEISSYRPNDTLAWRTLPGAVVKSGGIIKFKPMNGGTSVDIKLSYNPPAGALGNAFLKALGNEPKRKLDEDLMIMKEFIESSWERGEAPDEAILHETRRTGGGVHG